MSSNQEAISLENISRDSIVIRSCTLVNAHIHYGADSGKKFRRRILEVYALAKWANERVNDIDTYDKDIILIGDFNVPKFKADDPVLKRLRQYGIMVADYSTQMTILHSYHQRIPRIN